MCCYLCSVCVCCVCCCLLSLGFCDSFVRVVLWLFRCVCLLRLFSALCWLVWCVAFVLSVVSDVFCIVFSVCVIECVCDVVYYVGL